MLILGWGNNIQNYLYWIKSIPTKTGKKNVQIIVSEGGKILPVNKGTVRNNFLKEKLREK